MELYCDGRKNKNEDKTEDSGLRRIKEWATKYPIYFDLHTHSISSGHGSTDTVLTMIRQAKKQGLKYLGISDHGPATKGSASVSYFRGIRLADKYRYDMHVLYGVELNILNMEGQVDLPENVLERLDYAFVSIHPPIFTPYQYTDHTDVYMKAMEHSKVKFLGHIDDARFPVDFARLLRAAKERNIYPEINNSSLMPGAYRVGGEENCRKILGICKEIGLPVLLSSDSHGTGKIGDLRYIYPLLEECSFPPELVLNSDPDISHILK